MLLKLKKLFYFKRFLVILHLPYAVYVGEAQMCGDGVQ